MKNVMLMGAVALGCGGYEGELEELGTAEQAIYMPTLYGGELSNGAGETRCSPPWTGAGQCWVPDTLTWKVWVDTGNCSQFFADRINEQFLWWETFLENRGWAVSKATNLEVVQNKYNLRILCSVTYTNFGKTNLLAEETHSTPHGTLVQYDFATVYINDYQVITSPAWGSAPLNKQVNFSSNVIRHELMHVSGIGHETYASGGLSLMDQTYGAAVGDLNKGVWTGIVFPTTGDADRIDCYNPTSGTGDRCAD